jgi:hypothetical protein
MILIRRGIANNSINLAKEKERKERDVHKIINF